MKRLKWHMLALARVLIAGHDLRPLNSKQVEQGAQKVIEVMGQHGQAATDIFLKAVDICQKVGDATRDRLKRQAILGEMMAMAAHT